MGPTRDRLLGQHTHTMRISNAKICKVASKYCIRSLEVAFNKMYYSELNGHRDKVTLVGNIININRKTFSNGEFSHSIDTFFVIFTSLDLEPLCIWRASEEMLFILTCTRSAKRCLDSANRDRALLDDAEVIAMIQL